jgi:hypothetical protein
MDRVLKIVGSNAHGSCVFMEDRIITVAHLGFLLGAEYDVTAPGGRNLKATCYFINNANDFAFLRTEGISPSQNCFTGGLSAGRPFYVMGYPSSSQNEKPSMLKITLEGLNEDGRHFNGVPGARSGYSGAPVVSKYCAVSGLIVGGFRFDKNSQSFCRILPMTTIKAFGGVPSDYSSLTYFNLQQSQKGNGQVVF